jgi:hypothetical protein
MMKAVGLGAAALAVPGLVAGCSGTSSSSSSGGRIAGPGLVAGCSSAIVLEETKPEVVPYFTICARSSTRARSRSR